ncbi:ATPase family AAA domain-containing protein [Lachnellula occidentalis]|uniref:ATPase family AAA domain-containing protein n=1 Tax=Lachnellula occidentalis TaxID=215460 RepID=A0A8H8S4D6_9HELO|nr:ATPase family AAA domain-containing protein [Lachnellula occidentalis]
MHAVAFHAIRTARRPISRCACRIVAGVRYPVYSRPFHRSPISLRKPEEPAGQGDGHSENPAIESSEGSNENAEQDGTTEASRIAQGQTSTLAPKPRNGNGKPTSGRLKGNRPRQTEGLPRVQLPEWFWEKNVKCLEDPAQGGTLAVYGITGVHGELAGDDSSVAAEVARMTLALGDCDLTSTKDAKYSMHVDVYKEILSSLQAGLSLRPPKNSENLNINRPITLLQCPKDGGAFYLDSVVETIATKLGADLIRLDAQDIAQIVGPYVDENVAWTSSRTALLGYEAQKVAGKLEAYDTDPAEEDAAAEEEEDATKRPFKLPDLNSIFGKYNKKDTRQPNKSPASHEHPLERLGIFDYSQNPQSASASTSESDQWNNLKFNSILSELVAAADVKRAASPSEPDGTEPVESKPGSSGTIVQVRDYKALTGTQQGADLLQRLRTAINKRWKDGKNIICVGTYSSEEGETALSRPDIQHLQSDVVDGEKSTIFVPPDRRTEQDVVFETDEKARVRTINIRHVEDMVSKLADGTQHLTPVIDLEKGLDNTAVNSAGLEDAVWTYARVRRLAMTILGSSKSPTIDGPVFSEALRLLSSSDEAKFSWGAAELKEEDSDVDTLLNEVSEANKGSLTKDKLKQIKKKCNSHEEKLLSGVVFPADIRTTFDHIRAPKETVEALKTLTSLSLVRPESFSYGVLATDKIPGLLLYGPPGTGKTLLAKAVAKESGATVLEISGADVNDMFVGEGEKNVKAVFSLAKKLSPCVVFVDEADAIFSSRGETRRSGSHRELINQFLREWDGMNDFSAFIMVATNRPFDLDEAVLRRLPRRLLVDLPVEKDREAILKIHLKEELLDESVSLSGLAKDTPFYSGSDLKNISVAAALACVREENEAATKHTGDEPYEYPEKRILTKQHFDKALEEISASISEDMSTLSAIRKFDEKYGDRKGRRKKTSALGFGGTTVVEKDSEAARVRKLEV